MVFLQITLAFSKTEPPLNQEIPTHGIGCMIYKKEGGRVDIFLPMDKY
jgi:hypothetical protein